MLDRLATPAFTASELEERFLTLCTSEGLPRPEVNAWLRLPHGEALKVDFLWRAEQLVVETDGYRFHAGRRSFEADRRRDQALLLAGFRAVRFTWRQVVHERAVTGATLRSLGGWS